MCAICRSSRRALTESGAPNEVGQAQHHILEPAEVLDPLQRGDFLFDEACPVRTGPATRFRLTRPEKRLGKPAELRQASKNVRVLDTGLGVREGTGRAARTCISSSVDRIHGAGVMPLRSPVEATTESAGGYGGGTWRCA